MLSLLSSVSQPSMLWQSSVLVLPISAKSAMYVLMTLGPVAGVKVYTSVFMM